MVNAREIREKVVYVAEHNIYGEQDANNDGEFIRSMGGVPGEEWCGLYAGYCHRRAHKLLGLPDPRWAWRRYPSRLEVGAKALVKAFGAEGKVITRLEDFLPGDLLAFHRRTGIVSWKGHAAVCVGNDGKMLKTLEGNVGEFPAMVQPFWYRVGADGTWLRTSRSGKTTPVRFAFGAGVR